mgnify:CR=1 FL=1
MNLVLVDIMLNILLLIALALLAVMLWSFFKGNH